MGKHSTVYTNASLPKEVRPISSWGYVGYSVLYSIPVIGWLFLLIFTFSRNKNRRNFARSYWCRLLIVLIILALCALGYVVFREDINNSINDYMTKARATMNEMELPEFLQESVPEEEYPEVTEEEVPEEEAQPEIPEEEEVSEDDIAG